MIFNPYFSTKKMASKKGVGLGLALGQSIINKHDGRLSVESFKDKGTTVFIYLPADREKAKAESVVPTETKGAEIAENS